MITLKIENFSCIDAADIELGQLTILIGPQASGKSVISKLVYFCNDLLLSKDRFIEERRSIDEFIERIELDFNKWFPPQAWGKNKFSIEFSAGPFSVCLTRVPARRRKGRKTGDDKVHVDLSSYFLQEYDSMLKAWQAVADRQVQSEEMFPSRAMQRFWSLQDTARKRVEKALGNDYVSWQVFIPAGRSFFTSLSKAIAVFEHSGMLDAATVRFGRLFTTMTERRVRRFHVGEMSAATQDARRQLMQRFFGGNIKYDREQEYVETPDGRKLPFSLLSSGQQELLPLWMTIEQMLNDGEANLAFIEEPEAHLFPSAQTLLTNFLASFVSSPKSKQRIIVTTHSPYLLAHVNNLLKAGSLASAATKVRQSAIEKIVPRASWLRPETVKAYAIRERGTDYILDEDGLINGDYLDEVSGDIAATFSSLLEIENRK